MKTILMMSIGLIFAVNNVALAQSAPHSAMGSSKQIEGRYNCTLVNISKDQDAALLQRLGLHLTEGDSFNMAIESRMMGGNTARVLGFKTSTSTLSSGYVADFASRFLLSSDRTASAPTTTFILNFSGGTGTIAISETTGWMMDKVLTQFTCQPRA